MEIFNEILQVVAIRRVSSRSRLKFFFSFYFVCFEREQKLLANTSTGQKRHREHSRLKLINFLFNYSNFGYTERMNTVLATRDLKYFKIFKYYSTDLAIFSRIITERGGKANSVISDRRLSDPNAHVRACIICTYVNSSRTQSEFH